MEQASSDRVRRVVRRLQLGLVALVVVASPAILFVADRVAFIAAMLVGLALGQLALLRAEVSATGGIRGSAGRRFVYWSPRILLALVVLLLMIRWVTR